MKILLITDTEQKELWDYWGPSAQKQLADVDLILSAGDLDPAYLEFLVTMTNLPLVYVRGNHDSVYENRPPQGCICAEDSIITLVITENSGKAEDTASGRGEQRIIRIAGLGGSIRYREGSNMYTEEEMKRRAGRLTRRVRRMKRIDHLRTAFADEASFGSIDILLTHAPCRGYGDMEDLPHQGFECFNDLLGRIQPKVHCYGHVHESYGSFARELEHPSGTRLINGCGKYIFEI